MLNKVGKLIGVNTQIATPSGGNVGIGFAIPVDTVNQVVTELIRNGRILKPDLGLTLFDQQRVRRAGYPKGVMVAEILPSGPAAQAGLRGIRVRQNGRGDPGDLIVAIDGQSIDTVADYQRVLGKLKPGQQIKVKFLRDDEEKEVSMTVQGA